MAKTNTSGKQKRKTAAKKPASKRSPAKKQTSKKPAVKKSTPKKSGTAKPASKKKPVSKKKPAAKKTVKSASGKKSTAQRKTGTKRVAAGTKAPSRKSTSRSTARKPRQKSPSGPSGKFAGIYGVLLFLLVAVGLSGGIYAAFTDTKVAPENTATQGIKAEGDLTKKTKQFPKTGGKAAPPALKQNASGLNEPPPAAASEPEPAVGHELPDTRPQVAIIIDDIGHRRDIAEKFFKLDVPFTYAILPHSRYTKEIAESAVRRGYQVMLHLPMEPNEYPHIDPGPGALLTSMTPDERIKQLEDDLDAVPHIKGVNNHMGSKMTAMFPQMNQVFTVLKKRGLFFIDSRTSAASQCRSSAQLFDLPFAERDVFLDNVQTRQGVSERIEELMNIAEIKGVAIGIGHPYEITYAVLADKLPEIKRRVRLVSASELVIQ